MAYIDQRSVGTSKPRGYDNGWAASTGNAPNLTRNHRAAVRRKLVDRCTNNTALDRCPRVCSLQKNTQLKKNWFTNLNWAKTFSHLQAAHWFRKSSSNLQRFRQLLAIERQHSQWVLYRRQFSTCKMIWCWPENDTAWLAHWSCRSFYALVLLECPTNKKRSLDNGIRFWRSWSVTQTLTSPNS